MSLTPWRPQLITDRLLEMGPSSGDLDANKYNYLEFRNAGRVRNVTVFADLQTKLDATLGMDDCVFHLLSGQHLQTGDVSNVLVAVGRVNEPIYGVDLKARGSSDAIADAEKVRRIGKLMQWGGAALFLIGIPLVLIFVGIFLMGSGYFLWRNGKRMAQGMQYQVEMLEQCSLMVSRIPGIRLV